MKKDISIIATIKNRCVIPTDPNLANVGYFKRIDEKVLSSFENKFNIKTNAKYFSEPTYMFREFLESINKMSEYYINSGMGNIELVVTDWNSYDADVEEEIKKYWDFEYKFLNIDQEVFSKGYGINSGMEIANYENIYITDVDIKHLSPLIFEDFRKLTSNEAFFPIVIKQKSPCGVEYFTDLWGFGLCYLNKQVALDVGGIPDIRKWGGEDVSFYSSVEKLLGIENIKREIRPDLLHIWHKPKLGQE